MRQRRSFHDEPVTTDINLSPLIDMVFILLIFFIVTTVFVEEHGLRVDPADFAADRRNEEIEPILFTLTSSGDVLFEGRSLGAGGVSATVRDRARRASPPVIIEVGKGASASVVVRVIDEAKLAGAENVSLTSR